MMNTKEAIKVLENMKNYMPCEATEIYAIDIAMEALDESKWIPISVGMPVATQRVLVTLQNECVCEVFYINNKFKFHESKKGGGMEDIPLENPVIAWKPLPEAYIV